MTHMLCYLRLAIRMLFTFDNWIVIIASFIESSDSSALMVRDIDKPRCQLQLGITLL